MPLATAYNRIVKKYRLREMQELSMGIWDDDNIANIVIIDDDESCWQVYILNAAAARFQCFD